MYSIIHRFTRLADVFEAGEPVGPAFLAEGPVVAFDWAFWLGLPGWMD